MQIAHMPPCGMYAPPGVVGAPPLFPHHIGLCVVMSFITLYGVRMPDDQKEWFDLVKHNFRNPDPATTQVVNTVRGLGFAERMVEVLDNRLTSKEREAGFSHFLRKGQKPAGAGLRKRRGPLGPPKHDSYKGRGR